MTFRGKIAALLVALAFAGWVVGFWCLAAIVVFQPAHGVEDRWAFAIWALVLLCCGLAVLPRIPALRRTIGGVVVWKAMMVTAFYPAVVVLVVACMVVFGVTLKVLASLFYVLFLVSIPVNLVIWLWNSAKSGWQARVSRQRTKG